MTYNEQYLFGKVDCRKIALDMWAGAGLTAVNEVGKRRRSLISFDTSVRVQL